MASINSVISFLNKHKADIVSIAVGVIGVALVAIGFLAVIGVPGLASITAPLVLAMLLGGGAIASSSLIIFIALSGPLIAIDLHIEL